MAKPPPGTTDCVALIYLPRIQDTSEQNLPGADQSVEGDDSGEGSESSSQHALPANPVDDAGKIVGDSQRMICPWMTGETEMSCYEKKKRQICVFHANKKGFLSKTVLLMDHILMVRCSFYTFRLYIQFLQCQCTLL